MLSSLVAVLFDLDDTLLDSFGARASSLQEAFTQADILSPTAEQFLRNLHGTQLKEALDQLVSSLKTSDELFESYRLAYWGKKSGIIKLYPGVKIMLEELHQRGVKLGIVTQKARHLEINGLRAGAITELEELGIDGLFSVIVGFEDVTAHKPSPEGINIALSRLAAGPTETLYVGDSAADIAAAQAAGCWSCYATWGIPSVRHKLDGINPDLVAGMPGELVEMNVWSVRTN